MDLLGELDGRLQPAQPGRRDPPSAPPGNSPKGRRALSAEHHTGKLGALVFASPEEPVELGVEPLSTSGEVDVGGDVVVVAPTDTQTDVEAATGEVVQVGELFSEQLPIAAQGRDHDRGEEPDRVGDGSRRGEGQERVKVRVIEAVHAGQAAGSTFFGFPTPSRQLGRTGRTDGGGNPDSKPYRHPQSSFGKAA